MLVALCRETVDELNDDVLQPSDGKAVDDVDDSAALHVQAKE
ncbi:hypothetical protein SDC9_167826 [bioreactor metagenome]|uniref:Uncharacterized protein n=1 Tax=bioreactor metagenome TaxID=1076179 RepID=A0A645G0T8_9ZZZZ